MKIFGKKPKERGIKIKVQGVATVGEPGAIESAWFKHKLRKAGRSTKHVKR